MFRRSIREIEVSPGYASTNQSAPDIKQEAVSLNSNDEFDDELLAAFKVESEEQLETAEYQLLILESDPENSKAINALFRAFHTIKGNAGFLKIDPLLGNLAHDAETLLSLCRDGYLKLNGQNFDLILESSVLMRSLLQSLNNSIFGTPTSDLIQKTAHLRQCLSVIAQQFNAAATSSASPEVSTTDASSKPSPSSDPIPNTDPSDFFEDEECPSMLERKTRTNAIKDEAETKQDKSQNANETLRVDRGRLDLLVELIGELVIAESMARQDATNPSKDPASLPAKLRNMAQLNRITRTLQELGLSLRMVPLRSTFQKMTRVARDLMRKLDKPVDFIVEGENTELDKTFVDAIGDPLMHMVRNAIDHGIEASSEERVVNGKPPRGKVVLRAFHQSGNIHIEIQDDGRGLNAERILAKAKHQKLVNEDANLSESEIFALIFEPGFSTADKVTDVSGRGVGMDVVRRNIQALRGSVDINTTLGHGSCFTIRLPLTLAVIDGLVVRVGSGRYVVPTLSVTELIQFSGAQISTIANKYSILTVRDQNVQLIRLDKALGLPIVVEATDKGIIVVVQDGPHTVALVVDEVLGQQQVVIKQLGHNMEGCKGVAGGAIMPDGQIGIILDVHCIIAQSRGKN